MDRSPAHLLAGIRRAAEGLNAFLDAQLAALKLAPTQLALVGFSQGTMLALHVALRRTPQIACVVGYSGALIGPETLAAEIDSRPPVCLIHGQSDEVVPFAAMAHAKAALAQAGVPVETYARPYLGHSIDMEGIAIARAALGEGI